MATDLGATSESLGRLLNAGVVLRLLESDDAVTYRLTAPSKRVLLSSAGEAYLGDWLRNMEMFETALSELDQAAMTSTPTVDPNAHIGSSPAETRDFTLAMHNYASYRGQELASFLDTTTARSLLDLGCGPGTYAFHLGLKNPNLEIYLLDLPGVLEVAREVRDRYDLSNEIHYLPLDVTRDAIPGQYDIVLVSNTLHMLGEANSRALIKRLYDTVSDGGSLVIQAQYLQNHRMGGRWPVFLDLVQLCITEEGRNHTEAETRQWMEEAGFQSHRIHTHEPGQHQQLPTWIQGVTDHSPASTDITRSCPRPPVELRLGTEGRAIRLGRPVDTSEIRHLVQPAQG